MPFEQPRNRLMTTKLGNCQSDKGALRIANKELQIGWAHRKSWKSFFFQSYMVDIAAKALTK